MKGEYNKEIEKLENLIFEKFVKEVDGIPLYKAGLPGYASIFARDSILSCLLMQDTLGMRCILKYCINKQGKEKNPLTGEERGKIFHELPPIRIRNLSTEFNASDTTALFLIGMNYYNEKMKDDFVKENRASIEKAVDYISRHIRNDLFIESPKFSNAENFALKATYWKDSKIIGRKNGEPVYPVAYFLLQAQVIAALRSAAKLTGREELNKSASRLNNALWSKFYDSILKTVATGMDRQGLFHSITSDALHALYYLEKEDVPKKRLENIVETSKKLETPIGYRTACINKNEKDSKYHFNSIWPFEQAFIHAGSKKFGLEHAQEISSRLVNALGPDNHEYLLYHEKTGKIEKKGCNLQLWTIASKLYFLREAG